ncbi:MAG: hypothetical protein JO167_14020 [Alphaproteobacteria bacterium]|nr:hypothetical protein [Alphaproteobacteria bacterium]
MDSEDDDAPVPAKRNTALIIWASCVAVLLGPSLLVWIVRGVALAAQCAPGPEPCRGVALGGGLRDALNLAWLVSSNTLVLVAITLAASIAILFNRRPLIATITLLLLPLASLMLPMAAVYSALYRDCQVSEAGIGDCTLWGAQMGMSFHTAASVPWLIYGFAPYSFAIALMLGIVGWFFTRPRAVGHATASPHRFPDERFRHRD